MTAVCEHLSPTPHNSDPVGATGSVSYRLQPSVPVIYRLSLTGDWSLLLRFNRMVLPAGHALLIGTVLGEKKGVYTYSLFT